MRPLLDETIALAKLGEDFKFVAKMTKSKDYTSLDNRSKVVQEIEVTEKGARIHPEELLLMKNQMYKLFPPLDKLFLEAPLCEELQEGFRFQKSNRGYDQN